MLGLFLSLEKEDQIEKLLGDGAQPLTTALHLFFWNSCLYINLSYFFLTTQLPVTHVKDES